MTGFIVILMILLGSIYIALLSEPKEPKCPR